MQTSEHVAAA